MLLLGLTTQGFAPPRSLFVPSQWIGLLPWGPEAPEFPWMAALHPPIGMSLCSLSPSPADKELPATLQLSPAHIWPSPHGPIQLEAPRGPEPWPRPQISSCCLGLGPSLMVHTPFVPEFPQKVASTPSPLPRARLQNAETMESPRQISNRPAVKSPTASACTSGDRRWQLWPQSTWAGLGLGGSRGVGAQT